MGQLHLDVKIIQQFSKS